MESYIYDNDNEIKKYKRRCYKLVCLLNELLPLLSHIDLDIIMNKIKKINEEII